MTFPSTTRFAVRRCLGEGGMGVVYEVYDQERRAPVALKTLSRFDGRGLARFKREFRAVQGLSHPNLVALDELFVESDQWFFTMELVNGVDFVTHVTGRTPTHAFESTKSQPVSQIPRAGAPPPAPPAAHSFDDAALRDALRQLVQGLSALHAADMVHRDIKPSNVLVTREGRLVLLDFGLVTEVSTELRSTGRDVVGTPVYMAPEQAASRAIGPPADLYAVGVMLYEALTGRLPFDGPSLQILLDKQTREPEPPASVAAGVPQDLDALCRKLLRFDPAARPTAADVLQAIAVKPGTSLSPGRSSNDVPIFVGRKEELVALRAAFDASTNGAIATVLIWGESGIGKSYLVRRFTDDLVAQRPEVVLLQGRCYERESVPYKALDGIVDALGRRLSHMSPADVAAALPTRPAALGQVFPALLRVPQIAREPIAVGAAVEPHELRQRAFASLRELLVRLSGRWPTVAVIDDLHWADDDGLRALAEIVRPPDAPPLLLVATVRAATEQDEGLARVRAALPGEPHLVHVRDLGGEDARALAIAALRRNDVTGADAEVIASEAHGHPLFVEELARHVASGGSARAEVKLDEAIWSRILLLEGPARELAELVALAGKPIPQEVAAAAAHVEPAEFVRRAAALRVSNLVRTGGARWADAIEPYHDRVREAVLARLTPDRKRALHEALAVAFEASPRHDAETLATHWREAGSAARAAQYAVEAGEQAYKTFAFDRAARWFEQALALTPEDAPSRRDLEARLGDALADAGRGAIAAPHFEAAAALSSPLQALDLRRRAAEQLLRSGHFDRGMDATRSVLAAIRMRLPRTLFGTFALLLFFRAVLRVRGLRFRAREAGYVSAEQLARFEVCMSVGMTLSFVDSFVGFTFMSRALLLALRYGDLERVVRAFSMLIPGSAASGTASWRRTQVDVARARALAAASGTVRSHIFVTGCSGAAYYLNGRFAEAAPALRESIAAVGEHAPEMVFERVTLRMFLSQTLDFLGRFRELAELGREMLRDALARGDIYASVIARTGAPSLAWLAEDRLAFAEESVAQAMRDWSNRGFHLEHFFMYLARIRARLYAGDGPGAHALASECHGLAAGSLLGRIQTLRVRVAYLRAGAALLHVEGGGGDREALLAEAEGDARVLARERTGWTAPLADVIRAGIALHGGARDEVFAALEAAARGFDAADMAGYAAAARDRAARLRGDAAGVERAAAFFRAEHVASPEPMIAMLLPGLRHPPPSSA